MLPMGFQTLVKGNSKTMIVEHEKGVKNGRNGRRGRRENQKWHKRQEWQKSPIALIFPLVYSCHRKL